MSNDNGDMANESSAMGGDPSCFAVIAAQFSNSIFRMSLLRVLRASVLRTSSPYFPAARGRFDSSDLRNPRARACLTGGRRGFSQASARPKHQLAFSG